MIGITGNKVTMNIIMYYNDVDISIALKNREEEGDLTKMNVDSIKLFHKYAGDITNLYLHGKLDDNGLIYVDEGDELLDTLQEIITFIDRMNEFMYGVIGNGGYSLIK